MQYQQTAIATLVGNAAETPLIMTSREIAALTGKRHDNVKRTVETCAVNGFMTFPQTEETSFFGVDGRKQTATVFVLDKRASVVVVAHLCPEFVGAIIDRWIHLEAQVLEQAKQIAKLENEKLQLELTASQLELTASNLALETSQKKREMIVGEPWDIKVTQAAKLFNMPRPKFVEVLFDLDWVNRRSRKLQPKAEAIKQGYVKPVGFEEYTDDFGNLVRYRTQLSITPKGFAFLQDSL